MKFMTFSSNISDNYFAVRRGHSKKLIKRRWFIWISEKLC